MPGFLTKTRQETGADKPKFGGGGSWVDVDAMVARETVFAITNIEWDGSNEYNGTPRPRWVLDIVPWYDGDSLPGKAGEDGRLTQLDAGKLGLASHVSRDPLMNSIADEFEDENSSEIVDGAFNSPGVLVKIRVPGGKGGKYIDLCEWDEERSCPILSQGAQVAEDEEPRRPTGRQAPARGRQQPTQQPTQSRQRQEPEPDPPAQGRRTRSSAGSESEATTSSARSDGRASASTGSSGGFAGAGGAESDGPAPVPAPAGLPISAADLKIVSDVVGGPPYDSARELAEEYELEEGVPFPGPALKAGSRNLTGIKKWLHDHGIDDFPEGRGKIKPKYRNAFSIALRCWMEYTGRDADGNPVESEPHPGGPDHTAPYNQQPGRQREVRPAAVPQNAHEADQRMHPTSRGAEGGDQQPIRPDQKAAWLPPDQRERGSAPASEHVYEPGDVGDSIEPCPSCQTIVTGRAHPSGGGSYGIVHECPQNGATIPLQATNIRKG